VPLDGLTGSTGALKPLCCRLKYSNDCNIISVRGNILTSVHSSDPNELEKALTIFKSEGTSYIYDFQKAA